MNHSGFGFKPVISVAEHPVVNPYCYCICFNSVCFSHSSWISYVRFSLFLCILVSFYGHATHDPQKQKATTGVSVSVSLLFYMLG